MLKSIALAGATAALVIGSIAVAQTSYNNPSSTSANPNGATTSTDQNANQNANSMGANGSTSSANQYGANSSARTGERG
jgi:hypothetical protein